MSIYLLLQCEILTNHRIVIVQSHCQLFEERCLEADDVTSASLHHEIAEGSSRRVPFAFACARGSPRPCTRQAAATSGESPLPSKADA